MDCSCAACSSRNLHHSLICDGQTRTACGLKSPFTMRFVMANRDRSHRCGIHESPGGTDMARQRHFDCEYRLRTP